MPFQYPAPRRDDDVVDDQFGTPVPDPYRWMEDPASPELRAFIDAENALTQEVLEEVPTRQAIADRLTALYSYPSVPSWRKMSRQGEYYFYNFNDGQNQAAILRRRGVDGPAEIALDPNTLSADGTAILMEAQPSPDGKLIAYGISKGGTDWRTFYVRNIETGTDFPEALEWCKFTSVVWNADSTGFFYNVFDAVKLGEEKLAGNFNNRIAFHRVGTAQSEDEIAYEDRDRPELLMWPQASDDNQYAIVVLKPGSVGSSGAAIIRIADRSVVELLKEFDAEYEFAGNHGTSFYFVTSLHAPNKRVIAIDLDHPERSAWREIVPEGLDAIDAARLAGGKLVVLTMHNAHTQMKIYSLDGAFLNDVELPGIGTIPTYYLSTSVHDPDFLFTFTSYLYPMTILRYDTTSNTVSAFQASGIPMDASQYETKQIFFDSTDGARVSMFITHRKGLELNGQNPTVLHGYGGFSAAVLPEFEAHYALWIENGGVFAVVNLRGGSEYGEAWHEAGRRDQKQHVFDDMIGAAEWLIANGYTSTPKLAIRGMSNGGLLVGACMTQRPDLFGAVVCEVPVTDMLRYQLFTSGRLWTAEYGDADRSAEEFKWLHAYSPLHNVHEGVTYPPTIITTSEGDDRVVPMHSLKFAATLQSADTGKNPILLRFATNTGHGNVTAHSVVGTETDVFTFLSLTTGWQPN